MLLAILALSTVPPTLVCKTSISIVPFLVLVVGHTECGGAAACYGAAISPSFAPGKPVATVSSLSPNAPLNRWLAPLTNLAASLQLAGTPMPDAVSAVVAENVKMQVENLCQSTVITNAWAEGKAVWVHGFVYELATGKLKDLNVSQCRAA
jgi:carbonic anhydrase